MDHRDDSAAADVFDFIDAYLNDLEKGRLHPLAHWLARFPAHQDRIAREYLALKGARDGSDPSSPAADGAVRDGDDGGRSDDTRSDHVGPYRLLREIGRGGQGTVFLAEDARIARRVALKILTSRFDTVSDERLKRFRREAEVIARLEHPSLCGIYDADIDGATPYIAMRYVEGETLAEILGKARRERSDAANGTDGASDANDDVVDAARIPRQTSFVLARSNASADSEMSSCWPPSSAVDVHRVLLLFERTARALHAAHEAGVVHRDVKPGNIIVAPDGKPVVLDFGLARDERSLELALTQSDEVFGTPAYMSPEQLANAGPALDRRTDVYSLGATLYESLTLERPFDGAQRVDLYRAIESAPTPDPRRANSALSEDVKVVLETALEKDKQRRYRTALEFAEDLRRIREYEPIHARPAGVALRFSRWTRRHPALAVLTIGTIVALSAGLALALVLLSREQRALEGERRATARQQEALRAALGRHLAERSMALIAQDPSAALALGIEAAERAPNYLTRSALFAALDACRLQHVLEGNPDAMQLEHAGRRITDLDVGRDGLTIALALDNGTARVFDLAHASDARSLQVFGGEMLAIACSPDGHSVVTASADGGLRVWSEPFDAAPVIVNEDQPVTSIEFSGDGTRLISVTKAGHATIRDTQLWECALVFDRGDQGIEHAHFSPDGLRVLTSPAIGCAHAEIATLWDARDGRWIADLAGHRDAILDCAFSPNASVPRAVTVARDRSARVWDTQTSSQVGAALEHEAPVAFATFSADGRRLATATALGEEGWAYVFDLESGSRMRLEAHEGRKVVHAAFSPDGKRLATACFDSSVRIFDAASGAQELQLRSAFRPLCVRWCDGGRGLVSMTNGAVAHVWFTRNRPDMFNLKGHTRAVRSACFSPDGTLALTASEDHTARLWHMPSSTCEDEREPGALLHVLQHDGPLVGATFSQDGEQVLTISRDRSAGVWSARTGLPLRAKLPHPRELVCGSFDRDGRRVLTVCADGCARIWIARCEAEPIVVRAPAASITCAAFSTDGRLVATGGDDDAVRIWEPESGALVRAIAFKRWDPERGGGVFDLAFNPRKDEIAVACGDQRIRFFDLRTGETTRPDVVLFTPKSVCFSSDGSLILATGRWGGSALRVQDLDTLNTN